MLSYLSFRSIGALLVSLFAFSPVSGQKDAVFPYRQAGLTERQAAAHLLSRFTYGSKPGEVDEVVRIGLEKWFERQLKANLPDDSLQAMLRGNDAFEMTNEQIADTYVRGGQVLRMAIKDGVIKKDSISLKDKKAYREQLLAYQQQKGLRPERELIQQFINQKILRARYSSNQLQEVITDFWFNHFNVSFTKNDCTPFIPVYERDVIRPGSLGRFENLLIATAQSPAMLMYLDNFSSTGENKNLQIKKKPAKKVVPKKKKGLNENYAREVMELHTLGVDGGYTQADVTEAARVLTGWTVYPIGKEHEPQRQKLLEAGRRQNQRGVVIRGDFLFLPARHDDGDKNVLGQHFPAGGGYEEGVTLLKTLAEHPSTAHFICRKIAVRFVSDAPSDILIEALVKTFNTSHGDIRQILLTLVSSPEFWSEKALREKTKSPFELMMSSLRILNADIKDPARLSDWLTRMGQKLYYYQAPTGYPDKAQYWINTGSLLTRMNFGLAVGSGNIPGVSINLLALNNFHEPESSSAALITYLNIILPGRDLEASVHRLTPLLNDPELYHKVRGAANRLPVPAASEPSEDASADSPKITEKAAETNVGNHYSLGQVVGIIIGSPEFQRR